MRATSRNVLVCLAAGAASLLAGCKKTVPAPQAAAPDTERVIYTTFYPTTYFCERISGGLVPVECPLPEGEDPIFWQPSRETIEAYQNARLIVLNGADFEKWAATASLPSSRTVRSTDEIREPFITIEGVSHSHGEGGEHTHDGTDGHTWVDPTNALLQIDAIVRAMQGAFPEDADVFRDNADQLDVDMLELRDRLGAVMSLTDGATLLASHPAYNYIARRFDVTIRSFDFDPGTPLTDEQLTELRHAIDESENDGRIVLLWQSEPLAETRSLLRSEFGVRSVLFSPCATTPASGDYLEVMYDNIERLGEALTD